MMKDGIDPTSVEGAANIAYKIPNIAVDLSTTEVGVPVLWWRVVGSSHTTFAVEAFIDEVATSRPGSVRAETQAARRPTAHEAGAGTCGGEGRLEWRSAAEGRGRGIAVAEAFKTFVAQVAEVSIDDKAR